MDCKYYSIEQYLALTNNNDNYFSLINYNVRSFSRNFDTFFGCFESGTLPCGFALTETRFTANKTSDIPNYNGFHTTRICHTPSGGISVFIRKDFRSNKIDSLSYSNLSIEICTVEVFVNGSSIILLGIYRPHSDTVSNFSDHLNTILSNPYLSNKTCMILGDLNICLLKQEQPNLEFSNMLFSHHFAPLITKPTRFSPIAIEAPSLLDHIWYNNYIPHKCGIIELDITDHMPTFINLMFVNMSSSSKIKIDFRLINDSTKNIFKNNLESFNWDHIVDDDVDIYMENFTQVLNDLHCKSFPLKSKLISYKHCANPWFTSSLKKLIDAKSKYFQLLRLNVITVQENNLFRNKVNSLIRKQKFKFRKELFYKYKGNLMKTWKLINFTLSRNLKPNKIKEILLNDVIYEDDLDIANVFNNHFCSIGADLDSKIPASSIDPLSYINYNVNSTFTFQPVLPSEVCDNIQKLKNSRQDLDVVSVISIKDNAHFISKILAVIINLCFRVGKFPNCLKNAIVLPLFKKGDRNNMSNFRPISILPPFSKIAERCMKVRLVYYLNEYNLINPSQYGFQSGISTQNAILHLTEQIYHNLHLYRSTLGVFIDFSKAFDTVNRDILLMKLEKYGITGTALDLFRSYLSNRSQAVRVGSETSDFKEINLGLPQGSVLGPILYLIYVNEAPSLSDVFSSCLYCDDTTLIFEDHNYDSLVEKCNLGLQEFYTWCSTNRLSINVAKTGYMYFSNLTPPETLSDIVLNGTPLEKFVDTKFLGVTIDEKLKFNSHINDISKKISQNSGILYKLRHYVDISTLRSIYYSFIDCYINYCPLIFGNSFDTHLKPLEVAQKKCVRIIAMENRLAHSNPLFSRLKILNVRDIYKLNLGAYMYVNLESFSDMMSSHTYNTRSSNHYIPMRQRLTLTMNQSIKYQAPNNWNTIPDEIKNATSLSSFKRKYKQFLLANY